MFIHFLDFPHKGFRGIFNASIIRNFRSSESVVNHLPLRIKPVWVASLNRHPPCRHWQLSQTVNMATSGASMLAYKGSSNVQRTVSCSANKHKIRFDTSSVCIGFGSHLTVEKVPSLLCPLSLALFRSHKRGVNKRKIYYFMRHGANCLQKLILVSNNHGSVATVLMVR